MPPRASSALISRQCCRFELLTCGEGFSMRWIDTCSAIAHFENTTLSSLAFSLFACSKVPTASSMVSEPHCWSLRSGRNSEQPVAHYRTASGSDRIQALNYVVHRSFRPRNCRWEVEYRIRSL